MKPILDVCCGGRMFYFNKRDPRVVFCDIRREKTTLCDGRVFEVTPDVQCDFTNIPFPNSSFRMVVFDPPHLLLNAKSKPTGYQHIKYGSLNSSWKDTLASGFRECFRVLEPNGILIFKWSDIDIKVSEILKLTPEQPVFGNRCGKANKTHWICFVKSGERNEEETQA